MTTDADKESQAAENVSGGFHPIHSAAQLYRKFPKVYWIVLSFELLERGAYYSMIPLLSLHFYYNVGLTKEFCMLLTVFMYPFQYAMPILTSALAEKVGYRRQMIFGFISLFFAYIFLSVAFNYLTAILSVMMIGFGIGCYKPLISSTIAKSTEQKDRNVAYSVYYWIVNFAAAIFALFWGVLIFLKYLPDSAFAWIFRISAIYFLINILIAVFAFKEVPRSGAVRTIKDVGRNITTAFKDMKFVLMMLLIAGFWALYSVTLAPFIMIMYGFHFIPIWIPVILLGVVNPGTIILLGGPLSKYAEKIESIKLLMGGVFIYLIGMGLITFSLETLPIVILGMVIYSIGEFMVAPGYLAFVSKLAPKEKVSAYIGCNFLASFTGIFGGAMVFGLLAAKVGIDMARPHFFFGLVMGFGLLILAMFMIYNWLWGKDIVNRAKKIEMEETGAHEHEIDGRKMKREPILFKIFDYKLTMAIIIALIPVFIIASYSMGTNVFYPPEDDDDEPPVIVMIEDTITYSLSGYTNDGETTEVEFDSIGQPVSVRVSLSWTDTETLRRLQRRNDPDTFMMRLVPPNATAGALDPSESTDSGSITYNREINETMAEEWWGEWTLEIDCVQTGPITGFLGFLQWDDPGEEWEATIVVTFLTEEKE